ncbi:hypothetical protein [Paraburkholderia sp. 2C]
MKWEKLGLVLPTEAIGTETPICVTVPTPILLDENTIRGVRGRLR